MTFQPWRFRKLNIFLLILCLIVLATLLCSLLFSSRKKIDLPKPIDIHALKLPYSFQQEKKSYDQIGEPFFHLKKMDLDSSVPDLRTTLIACGISRRPDMPIEKTALHLSTRGTMVLKNVFPKEKVYLKCEGRGGGRRFMFSDDSKPTALWIEPEMNGMQVAVRVKMKNTKGKIISSPDELAYFTLQDFPYQQTAQQQQSNVELDGIKIDPTYFTQEKTNWLGTDLFLEKFGGEEYEFCKGRERIEFGDSDQRYSVFLEEGDGLIYHDGVWQNVELGPDSRGKPLLFLRKVAPDLMIFDLWDKKGKNKLSLDLRKQNVPSTLTTLDIKLLGARSRKEWIATINGQRVVIALDDWLIVNPDTSGSNGVKIEKITKIEQIEDYIDGRLKGELIVLEGMGKVNNQMCLKATQFSTTRTESQPLSIMLYKSWEAAPQATENDTEDNDPQVEDFDDDDEDDEALQDNQNASFEEDDYDDDED